MSVAAEATAWDGGVRPYAIPSLSSCLEDSRLTIHGETIPASRVEIDALRLTEWAIASKASLLLVPPDPLTPLGALLPAAIHAADMLEAFRASGVVTRSRRRLAVVSTDLGLRGLYRGLGVRPGPRSHAELLRAVVPAGTMDGTGLVRVLDVRDHGLDACSTVFCSSLRDAARLSDIDLVVVDLPLPDGRGLDALRVPVVFLARDPADPLAAWAVDKGVATFGWDDVDLREANQGELTARQANLAAGVRVDVVAVEAADVSENAELFWQDIGPLVRAGRSGLTGDLAAESFGIFHDLLGLAAPVAAADAVAGARYESRIAALARAARLAEQNVSDLYFPMVEAELQGLLQAIGEVPPKARALVDLVAGHLDSRESVIVVARTARLARMLDESLADKRLHGTRVASIATLVHEAPADVAILTGMAPRWARWVYRSGIGASVEVLGYVHPAGGRFDEAALIRRTVDQQRACIATMASRTLRAASWGALTGERVVAHERTGTDTAGPEVTVRRWEPPPDTPIELWDGQRWLLSHEDAATDGGVGGVSGDRLVAATHVSFEGGSWALFATDGMVTRWLVAAGRGEPTPAGRLRPGDRIVLIDGDGHKDLLSKVLQAADGVPALAVASAWVQHWRTVLARVHAALGSYEEMGRELHKLGCTVQAQTIRLWVLGITIGPDNPADLARVGELAGDPVLEGHYREIDAAIRALRGAHSRLGRRLAGLARRVGPAGLDGRLQQDEIIDDRSGLTVADFVDAVELRTVRDVRPAGSLPAIVTGRCRPKEEEWSL